MPSELNRIVTELIIDARGSVAGAAQHVRALKEAELATNKLSDADEKAVVARKKQAGSYIGVSTSIAKVRSEYTNLQAKMDPVFAAQVRHQKEMERAILVTDAAVRRGVTTEQQGAATIAQLRQRQIRDLQAVKDATQDVIRVQRAANSNAPGSMNTANIAAQFQDIGVTSAMGMSPLQIALQQGTQLQAVLGPMGAAGAVKALGAAFLSLINPVSLITLGLVAGTAALIQYFSTGEEEADELDEVLKQHADSIRALKDAYGEAADGAREYLGETASMAKALTLIAQLNLGETFRDQVDALVEGGQIFQAQTSQVKAEIERVEQAMIGKFGDEYARLNEAREALLVQLANAGTDGLAATKQFEPFKDEIADLIATIQAGSPDIIAFREAIGARINADPTNRALAALADELLRLIDGAYKSQSALGASEIALEEIRVGADATAHSIAGLTAAVGAFNSALDTMTGIAAPALSDAEQAARALDKALDAAGSDFILRQKALDTYAATMERIRNKIAGAEVPIPTPRPNDIEMWDEAGDAIDKAAGKLEQAKSRASGLIEKFFPGEAARREAQELAALLEQFGGHLDDMQRKAVEMRIDELFTAAAMGLRDLNSESRKGRNNLSDMEKEARRLEDALKDAASNFLQDLFTGKDVLESIVQLGSRFASMNFDKFVDMVSEGGLGGLFGGAAKSRPASKSDIISFGKLIGLEIADAVATSVDNYAAKVGPGRGLNAGGPPLEVNLSSRSATNVQKAGNAFLDLIGRYEGTDKGRGYNETLGYGRFTGGPRNLVSMTLDQIDALQTSMLRHTENTFNSSALGRYQIVRQTLRGLRSELGLSGDQLFSPKLQDELAMQLARARGASVGGLRNEWEGFRRTPDGELLSAYRSGIEGAVETGAKAGTAAGAEIGLKSAIEPGNPSATTPQQQQNGLGNFMGYASSALGGFSTGYQSQNAGMGALGGFMQGFGATGNILGGIVGGIAGLLGGIFGARNALKQAQRQLEKQMAQINLLLAVGEGTGIGAIQKKIADYTAETDKVVPLAWKAEDMKLVERLHQAVNAMIRREATDFYNALPGMIEGYRSGYGRQGAAQQGAEAVFSLREELRAMIADVRYFGQQGIDAVNNPTNKQWWLENYGQERWEEEARILQQRAESTLADAYEAARQMALAFITGTDELTDVQKAIGSLNGAAATLIPALVELGMTAEDAGAIIQSQVVEAMKKLREEFEDGLTADINSATDKGYLNDFKELFEQLEDVRADAARLGTSGALVDDWFKAMAQSVVDGAQLVGTSFEQLIDAFPQLEGVVHEFIEGLEDAATRMKDYEDRLFAATTDTSTMAGALAAFDREANRERERIRLAEASTEELVMLERVLAAERGKIMQDFLNQIAARRLGYQNRAFAATNDTSTLAGQLAAFDRAAAQERIEEIKAGGEAIRDLEIALGAERAKIIADWNKQIVDDQKRAAEEAQSFWDSWSRSIKEFVDHQRAGPQSPLSPQDRLAEAQANFAEQYAKALTGDRDAANSITSYASDLIDAGKDFWGSTMDFQNLWNDVLAKLEALPDQVSAEQFIVNEITEAIAESTGTVVSALDIMKDTLASAFAAGPQDTAAALALYFEQIDTSVNGLLTFGEIQAALDGKATDAAIRDMMAEIDLNGDEMISKLEAQLAAQGLTRTAVVDAVAVGPANTANLLSTYFNRLDTSVNGLLDFNEMKAALGGVATDAKIQQLINDLDTDNNGQLSMLELIKGATQGTQTNLDGSTGVIKQLVDLRAITQEKFTGLNNLVSGQTDRLMAVLNNSNVRAGGPGGFMAGGYTGDGAITDIAGAVHRREFVFDAGSTSRIGVQNLEMMQRGRMPVMRYGVNDNGNAALLAELRAVKAELAEIRKHAAATPVAIMRGAAHTADKLDEVVEATEAGTAAQERAALKRTG